ncbi:MAG: hypothetical protein ACRDH8_13025 [Actinomycetota bacterium]
MITTVPATIAALAALISARNKRRLDTGNGKTIGQAVAAIDERLERMEGVQDEVKQDVRELRGEVADHVEDRRAHPRRRS